MSLREYQYRLDRKNDQIRGLERRVDRLAEEAAQAIKNVDIKDTQIANFKEIIAGLSEDRRKLVDTISSLERDKAAMRADMKQLRHDLKSTREHRDLMSSARRNLEKRCKELRHRLDEAEDTVEIEIEFKDIPGLSECLTMTAADAEALLNGTPSNGPEFKGLQATVDELEQVKANYEVQKHLLATSHKDNENMRETIACLRQKHGNPEVRRLKKINDKMWGQMMAHKEKALTRKKENEKITAALRVRNSQVEGLQSAVHDLQNECEEVEGQLKCARDHISMANNQRDIAAQALDGTERRLVKKIEDLNDECGDLLLAKEAAEGKLDTARAANEIRENRMQLEIEDLHRQRDDLKADVEGLKNKYANLRRDAHRCGYFSY